MPSTLTDEEGLRAVIPLTKRQLRRLRVANQIPCFRLGKRSFLYDPTAVLAALRSNFEIKANGLK